MNDHYPHKIYIWDLDRPDSLFHARASAGKEVWSSIGGIQGRYLFVAYGGFKDIAESSQLAVTLGSTIDALRARDRNGIEIFLMGLPDTFETVERTLDERDDARVFLRVQPQPDGSVLRKRDGSPLE
jgi:hypothetical protein